MVQRSARWLLILTIGPCTVLVALYLLRQYVVTPFVERTLVQQFDAQLGIGVELGDVAGTYVTMFEIADLRTTKPSDKGPIVSLDLKHIQVRYSPLQLIAGLDAFLANTSIEIEGLRVVSRSATDSPPSEGSESMALPVAVPRVRIADSSVIVQGEGYRVDLQGIDLDSGPNNEGFTSVRLRVGQLGVEHPRIRLGSVPLKVDLTYTPEAVTVHGLDLGGVRVVEEARLVIGGLPTSFEWNARLRALGGVAEIKGALRGSLLEATWSIRAVDLSTFSAVQALPELPLAGVLDSRGRVKLMPDQLAGMEAKLELSLVNGAVRGVPFDRLDLAAAAADGTIRVGRFDVLAGVNRLTLTDVVAPAPAVLAGDPGELLQAVTARFSADFADVPALLGALGVNGPAPPAAVPAHRLALQGGFEAGAIVLERGQLSLADASVALESGRFSLTGPAHSIDLAALDAVLSLDVPRLGELASIFALPPLSGSLRGEVTVSGTLGAPRGSVRLDLGDFSFRGIAVGDAAVRAEGDAQGVILQSLEFRRGADRAMAQGRFRISERRIEKLTATFSVQDIGAYEDLLPSGFLLAGRPVRIRGCLEGSAKAEGPLDGLDAKVEAEARGLVFQGTELGNLSLRAGVTRDRVVIRSLELRSGQDRVSAKGAYDFAGRIEDGSLRVLIGDVGNYAKIFAPEVPASGRLEITVDVSGTLEAPKGKLDLSATGFKGFGVEVDSAALEAHGAGSTVRVHRLEARSHLGNASLSGILDLARWDEAASFRFETLDLARAGIELRLARPGGVSFEPPHTVRFENLALSGPAGAIALEGTLVPDGTSDLAVEISGVTGKGWLEEFVGEALSFNGLEARATLKGSLQEPAATVSGRVKEISGAKTPVPLSVAFDLGYSGQQARIGRLDVTAEGAQVISVRGEAPLRLGTEDPFGPGDVSLNVDISVPDLRDFKILAPDGFDLEGSLQNRTSVSGTWDNLRARFELNGRAPRFPAAVSVAPPGPFELEASGELEGPRLSLSGLRVKSPALSVEASGSWSGTPPLPDLLRGGTAELSGEISGRARLEVSDLAWVAPLVGGLRRTAGRIDGELGVEGPIRGPRVQARIRIADGEIRPEAAISSIRSLQLQALADSGSLEILAARGEFGGAPFEVSGTVGWGRPGGAESDLTLRGENLLLVRSEGVKVRADTDLTVKGPLSALSFAGEVKITDGRFVKNFDPFGILKTTDTPKTETGFRLFSIPDPPLKDAAFRIRVRSRNPFQIRNNFVRGAVRPELLLSGTGETPVLTGEIYVDSIRVQLPAGRLTFTSGVIRFLQNDPDRPRLDLRGNAEMMGYQITASVEGPYDAPVVTVSSVPPLPEDDLLLLLLTGQPPRTPSDRRTGQPRNMNVAVYLGRSLLSKWFDDESTEDGESMLDRFDIQVGRDVTRKGDETLDAQFRLARDVVRNGDTLYITGERDVFDSFNAGIKLLFRFR